MLQTRHDSRGRTTIRLVAAPNQTRGNVRLSRSRLHPPRPAALRHRPLQSGRRIVSGRRDAAEWLGARLRGERRDAQMCERRAACLQQLGEATKSIEQYKEILIHDAGNVEAIACVGNHFFYSDQPELAVKFYRSFGRFCFVDFDSRDLQTPAANGRQLAGAFFKRRLVLLLLSAARFDARLHRASARDGRRAKTR